jgi:hemerythrin-like metal-binding protein
VCSRGALRRLFFGDFSRNSVGHGMEHALHKPSAMAAHMVWTQEYSVGVRKLDEQHQELFRIVNELMESEQSRPNSQRIAHILDLLGKYAEYHFNTEERTMKEYGYPEYVSQVSEHTAFKLRIAGFRRDATTGERGLTRKMIVYLQEWLARHILGSDAKFKDFLLDNGFLSSANLQVSR